MARAAESFPDVSRQNFRRVLHPTDLKPTSLKALSLAIAIAQQSDADLVLMHALPPPTPIYEIDSPYRSGAEAELAALAQRVSNFGITVKRILVKGSNPVPQSIARCARFFKADIIVMAGGTRTGIARFLTGSMTTKVIRKAPCPVLIVRD